MMNYSCDRCGDTWSCVNDADIQTASECVACKLNDDAERKGAKVRILFDHLNASPPLSYAESLKVSATYHHAVSMRIIEEIVLRQCDHHGMWPYKRYVRRDGSNGYILVYFEPEGPKEKN